MESCWIFKMKDGSNIYVEEDTYKNHLLMLSGKIEVA
jgi:hypothetical protein